MQKIAPMLWFDTEAEEAAKFYVSVFKNSKLGIITHYGDHGPKPKGTVMTVSFQLFGEQFTALNGGPDYKFNESISLVVNCDSQEEIDDYWSKLTADGGKEVVCGWLKDKYGLCWQIVPGKIFEMIGTDPAQTNRVMSEVVKMVKLDMATLERAAKGK